MKVPNGGKVWDGNGWVSLIEDDDLPKPYPPKSNSHLDPATTIFIGVSAYRDRRCSHTLFNFLSKAKYPERIRIGVTAQLHHEDPDCIYDYCDLMKAHVDANKISVTDRECPYREQIKVIRVDYTLATGPCYGRHMSSYMLRDEEFCMQTDSHMDVVPEWDTTMLDMWSRTENEYGMLTTYVHVQESIGSLATALDKTTLVPIICQVGFTSANNPRYEQAKLAYQLPKPKLSTSFAGGFSFVKCHAWRAVPYDPMLKMVFDGEEFSMAARLWTRGYDFYTPDLSLIGHDYNQVKDGPAPSGWMSNPEYEEKAFEGRERLHNLLGILGKNDPKIWEQIGKYGLGNKRSFHQFQEFIGANTTTLEITRSRCNSIAWVPFEEEWPPTENNLSGPYSNELVRSALSRPVLPGFIQSENSIMPVFDKEEMDVNSIVRSTEELDVPTRILIIIIATALIIFIVRAYSRSKKNAVKRVPGHRKAATENA